MVLLGLKSGMMVFLFAFPFINSLHILHASLCLMDICDPLFIEFKGDVISKPKTSNSVLIRLIKKSPRFSLFDLMFFIPASRVMSIPFSIAESEITEGVPASNF